MNFKDMSDTKLINMVDRLLANIYEVDKDEVIERLRKYEDIIAELKRRGYNCRIELRACKEENYPICPHCNKEIRYLENVQECFVSWKLNPDGTYDDWPYDITSTDGLNKWVCPHCGRTIAETEEKALAFLNQKNNN